MALDIRESMEQMKARHPRIRWEVLETGQVHRFLPLLETILDRFGSGGGAMPGQLRPPADAPAGLPAPAVTRTAARPAAFLRPLS